jgi:hypothetical protein
MAAIKEEKQIKFTRTYQHAENQDGSHQNLLSFNWKGKTTAAPQERTHVLRFKMAAVRICFPSTGKEIKTTEVPLSAQRAKNNMAAIIIFSAGILSTPKRTTLKSKMARL